MEKKDMNWTCLPIYCPNCGQLNYGCKDAKERIRYECNRCTLVMIRVIKTRRQENLMLFLPDGMVALSG